MSITQRIVSVLSACVKAEASYDFTEKAMALAAEAEKDVLAIYLDGYKYATVEEDREYFMSKIKQFGDEK